MEKIKSLKNSPLSDALSRSGRRSEVFQDMSQLPGLGSMPELQRDNQQAYPGDPFQHQGPGLIPEQNVPPTLPPDSGRKTSYEELRNKNRAEYYRKQNMYAPPPTTPIPQQNNGAYNPPYQPPHPGPNAYPHQSPQDPRWMNPNQNQSRDDRESRRHDDDFHSKRTKYFDQSDDRYPKSSRRKYDDNDFS
uniref:Uncharacterized protein n=1 Tax=Romanomermis culicivorax TaxID=13658 RepID=A0A915JLP9_ROMCU